MNTPNGIFGTYRLVNEAIRPGDSPEDKLAKIVPITGLTNTAGALSGTTTVNVPFQPGTVVAYSVLFSATVAVVNGLNTITLAPAADTAVGAMIIGGAVNLQVATPFN